MSLINLAILETLINGGVLSKPIMIAVVVCFYNKPEMIKRIIRKNDKQNYKDTC